MRHNNVPVQFHHRALIPLVITLLCGPIAVDRLGAQTDVSGYVQTEWQHFDLSKDPNDRGFYSDERKNLFLIRRGRIKLTHTSEEDFRGVFQIDATERGVSVKDAYLEVPLLDSGLLDVTVGLFNKPNYEVMLSSSRRESPERSQVVRAFYPGERGLGFMFTSSPLSIGNVTPTLQLGLFNGNATDPETDAYKDFAGRVHFPVLSGDDANIRLGVGGNFYVGGLRQPEDTLITYTDGEETLEYHERNDSWPGYGNRSHLGVELQLGLDLFSFGGTELRGQYLIGTTPSAAMRDRVVIVEDPNPNDTIDLSDTLTVPIETLVLRNQSGYYLLLVQELGSTVSFAAKYDVFDRNTELAGAEVSSPDDRASTILGFGLFADFGPIRLTGWYEIPSFSADESRYTDAGGTVHSDDLKDNKTTIRFQYKMK